MNKYSKARKRGYTNDHDLAFKIWNPPVQCGDCYNFYDPIKNKKCPLCDGTEWAGSK